MKSPRSVIESGLRSLISMINDDVLFKGAKIKVSNKFDHFVDRAIERKIDAFQLFSFLKRSVFKHKCEIIFCCYLTNPPIRLNFISDDLVIGLTLHTDEDGIKRLRLRTIFENFEGRPCSRISTFEILE